MNNSYCILVEKWYIIGRHKLLGISRTLWYEFQKEKESELTPFLYEVLFQTSYFLFHHLPQGIGM